MITYQAICTEHNRYTDVQLVRNYGPKRETFEEADEDGRKWVQSQVLIPDVQYGYHVQQDS